MTYSLGLKTYWISLLSKMSFGAEIHIDKLVRRHEKLGKQSLNSDSAQKCITGWEHSLAWESANCHWVVWRYVLKSATLPISELSDVAARNTYIS